MCCAPYYNGWGIGYYTCADGVTKWGCCGNRPGFLGGCNVGCCNCYGCRIGNYDQWRKFCDGLESECEDTCDENPTCIANICKRDQQKCYGRYPGAAVAIKECFKF